MTNQLSPYMQGRIAYDNGKPNSSNPFPCGVHGSGQNSMSQKRVDWFNGWFDEWRWQKYGPNRDEQYEPLLLAG